MKIYLNRIKVSYVRAIEAARGFVNRMYLKNIHDIYSCSMNTYLKVICYDKYTGLKKLRIYTPKRVILQGFAQILKDYRELSSNIEVKAQNDLRSEYLRLYNRQLSVLAAIKVLSHRESIESYLLLQKLRITQGTETRIEALSKANTHYKGMQMNLNVMAVELEREQKARSTKKVQMSDYLYEMAVLRENGLQVDLKMSVAEFCMAENRLFDINKARQDLHNKKNGTGNN